MAKKPIVLFISDRPSGGAGESLFQIVQSEAIESFVVFSTAGYIKEKFDKQQDPERIYYQYAPGWLKSRNNSKLWWLGEFVYFFPRRVRFLYLLYRLVKKNKIELIHTNTITIIEGGIIARLCGIPHIIQLRELIDLDFYQYTFEKKFIVKIATMFSNAIICNSVRTDRSLHQFGGHKNSVVIYNIIEEASKRKSLHQEIKVDKSIQLVGVLGWIIPNKRIEDFVALSQRFKEIATVKFVIVGGYGAKEKYNKRIQNLIENSSNLMVTGVIPDAQEYLNSLSVLLCTCTTESFGRSVAEALVEGVPAIGVRSCAVAEIIEDNESGYLVDESDVDAMEERTKLLLGDETKRQKFGEHGKATVQRKFSNQIIIPQYLKLYTELIQREK